MSRSGTTWLMRCLNTHPDAVAFGETCYWGRKYIQPKNGEAYTKEELTRVIELASENKLGPRGKGYGSLRTDFVDNMTYVIRSNLERLAEPANPADVFLCLCDTFCAAEEKKIPIEKTPHHLKWIERIKEHLPQSKFVVMKREPYSFMLSYKYQGLKNRPEVRGIFQRMYHPMLTAIVWRGYARSIIDASERYKDSVLIVDLLDVEHTPQVVIDRVEKFFELRSCSREIPRAKDNSSFDSECTHELSCVDVYWMNLIAGREINELGYELRGCKKEILPILSSYIQIPIWMIRNAMVLKSKVSGSFMSYVLNWLR